MAKLLVLLGTTLGGAIGWWVGEHIGIMTAFFLSMIGMGAGLYFSRWVVKNYLG
jgi:hypothetical protein